MAQSYADSLLRDKILPTIHNWLDKSSPFMDKLEKTSKDIIRDAKGNYIVSKQQIQNEQGVGARGKGELLPTPVAGEFLDAAWSCKYNYCQFDIYGQDKILSDTNPNLAVVKVLTAKTESALTTFIRDRERQLYGDGSGTLASVAQAGDDVTTIVVDDVTFFERGMMIDIHETVPITNRQVTAIDPVAKTITISGNVIDVTAGTKITRYNAKNKEITGLRKALFPDSWTGASVTWGTYAGINRATYYEWRPQFFHNSGTLQNLTLDMVNELVAACQDADKSGETADAWLMMRRDLFLALVKMLQNKQVLGPITKINLGWEAPTFYSEKGPIPLVISSRVPANCIIYHNFRVASIRRPSKAQWMKGVNDQILRPVEGYDIFRATLFAYEEYVNLDPASCGVLADVQPPTS